MKRSVHSQRRFQTKPKSFWPSYLALAESGELARRADEAARWYAHCRLCPNGCAVDRTKAAGGLCRSPDKAWVASHSVHHGEEPPISGARGSGTIFFTNCTMHCVFCQNFPISQMGTGREVPDAELAAMVLDLQRRGCHNVNLVTPSHFVPSILRALVIAVEKDFRLPFVYNTSGYDSVEALRLLDGVIDIYMPDIKYASNEMAKRYSMRGDYVERNRAALKEMYRQVGRLKADDEGTAVRGLLVRHLVLPGGAAGSIESLRWLAEHVDPRLHLSVMSQYFPAHRAHEMPPMDRRVTPEEYKSVTDFVEASEFQGWTQPFE